MPVLNRVADLAPDIAAWRQDFHRHPEVLYDVHRTAAIVAEKLRAFGFDRVETGVGRTGVVGELHGRGGPGGRRIAVRADMDALPIEEIVDRPYKSAIPGAMHACGHDGHTAMLLGAARHLAETRGFDGTVVFIFQPAEEGGAGARTMLEDGLLERFPFDEVYGLHNMPGIEVGRFAIRPGPMMASADVFTIHLEGSGGHAAKPHLTVDPVLAGAHVVTALQSIVARNADPLAAAVLSVTQFHAGDTTNVIPQTATLSGTVRTLDPEVRKAVEDRLRQVAIGTAAAFGATATVTYNAGYPVTLNDPDATRFAADIARHVAGDSAVDEATEPMMGAEDFSYLLERRPGAYIFMGNGPSAGLHHPAYDFDDAAIPYGVSWWVTLVERALAR
ncbi:M20 aminoacylase family protein [Chthonobacter rhizosphaerae]|uniref:M20 aminoacylase family protein n=1 Tax=Chthonobacter rhizosphaerae TaxID=2735553 RepID=UPI0015EF77AD|nr:M20 aminoacylase family protein [Chthonobacter rhizosphaerae]